MVMRMNQQYQPRPNGFPARQKHGRNGEQPRHQHPPAPPKQEFKPVAILKRGDPAAPAVVSKDDGPAKENISANGQPTKPTSYRVRDVRDGSTCTTGLFFPL